MENVTKVAAYVPVSREVMADTVDIRRLLRGLFDDSLFYVAVGRPKVNPNPFPRMRPFRWLPGRRQAVLDLT